MGLLLSHNALQQVAEVVSGSEPGPSSGACPTELCIGAGLPLIPPRLVTRIESGEFIEMAELLPDNKSQLNGLNVLACIYSHSQL